MSLQSGALILSQPVKVNACGRVVDISQESATSMALLRRELVTKLRVCNPASLQLTDACGKIVQSDSELISAMQEQKLPLQAKLTVAALHEIEQKKKEGRNKEHDMVGLQWQIVIEQVAAFSNELASMGAQLQSVHDDSRKIVHQFEEEERLRRSQLLAALKDETTEREAAQRDFLAKLDEVVHMVMEEKSHREVSDYQLSKQVEQVTAEVNAARNGFDQEQAQVDRLLSSIRADMEAQNQKNSANWNRWHEATKRQEAKDQESQLATASKLQRIAALEAESKKLRGDVDSLDMAISRQTRETQLHLKKHGEELVRTMRDGSFGRGHELQCVARDHETSWQSLEQQLQQAREESMKTCQDLEERSKLLELRCAALEKECADRWDAQASKDNQIVERMSKTGTAVDSAKMERYASDALLRTTSTKVEELSERVRAAEGSLVSKVHGDHMKAQMDQLTQMIMKQEAALAQVERDFNTRFAQEAAHRDDHMEKLHGTVRNVIDKVSGDSIPIEDRDRKVAPSRELVRSVSPQASRVRLPTSSVISNGSHQLSPVGNLDRTMTPQLHAAPTHIVARQMSVPTFPQQLPGPGTLPGGSPPPTHGSAFGWNVRALSPTASSRGGTSRVA
eukprot:TRINITY_DN55121_c0_g1_i1.p1 TRINITY_DN55121_c0_g1~~TRINITY_DN55121_c0_g1_i1.p1  ORF type:complete len:623 (+),score=198.77 TRINITY_DN55121_c0_g1_i1:84-1952(+)